MRSYYKISYTRSMCFDNLKQAIRFIPPIFVISSFNFRKCSLSISSERHSGMCECSFHFRLWSINFEYISRLISCFVTHFRHTAIQIRRSQLLARARDGKNNKIRSTRKQVIFLRVSHETARLAANRYRTIAI